MTTLSQRTSWLWPVFIISTALMSTHGVELAGKSVTRDFAGRGESVTLECHFTISPEDLDQLTIEWLYKPREGHTGEEHLISFSGATKCQKRGTEDRVHFSSPNPQDGNASLTLNDLELADTGIYRCMIKSLPKIQSRDIVLRVIEKLRTPVCALSNDDDTDELVTLTCRVPQDNVPGKFSWIAMTGKGTILRRRAHSLVSQDVLFVHKIGKEDFGTYRCVVKNPVSEEHCDVILRPKPQTTTAAPETDETTAVASVPGSGGLGHVPPPEPSASSRYDAARGENVTLECHFTIPPEDLDQLTIEWLFGPRDGQTDEERLVSFSGGTKYHKSGTEDRVHFSLTLNDLELTDTGRYRCTMKTLTRIQSKYVVLNVVEKLPSQVTAAPITAKERESERAVALPETKTATYAVIEIALLTSATVIVVVIVTVCVYEYCKRKRRLKETDEQERFTADAEPKDDSEHVALYKMCDSRGTEISQEWIV